MKRLVVLLLIIAVGLVTYGCCGATTQYEEGQGGASTLIEIKEHHSERVAYLGYLKVVGTAENVAGRPLSYCEVRVKFYDAEGAQVGDMFDNVADLDTGRSWKFEVTCLDTTCADAVDYDIGVGDCY